MKILISTILLFLSSCEGLTNRSLSFWEKQKNNFRYQNKKEFISDDVLWRDFESNKFKKIRNPMLNKTIAGPGYLYSWQVRDSTKNEFTIIEDGGELGLAIYYFIVDKKDSLLSWTKIAGKGNEGGYWFETRSEFIHKDTLLHLRAITQWLGSDSDHKIEKLKGDTSFSYLTIHSNGNVTGKVFKEVNDLQYKNE